MKETIRENCSMSRWLFLTNRLLLRCLYRAENTERWKHMNEIANSPTAPTRLYALLLRLRPLQQGTLMPFSGELIHGAFLKWLLHTAPEVAAWLHEGQKRRLFTCSNLHFAQSMQPLFKAERENIHLPLNPEKTYTL